MKTESLLLLERYAFRRETNALFDLLTSSPMARESFFNNPAGVVRSMFMFTLEHDKFETPQDETTANRLLFSIVSNPRFFEFLNKNRNSANRRLIDLIESLPDVESCQAADKARMIIEFTDAFAFCDDNEILEGRPTTDAAFAESLDSSPVVLLVLLFVIGVIAVVALADDHRAVPRGPGASADEMRSLASALAIQAKLAETSRVPLSVAASLPASAPAEPWMTTRNDVAESQSIWAN